jgi:hypothetical protein
MQRQDEGAEEAQRHGDGSAALAGLAAGHQVDQDQDQQQPLDLGDRAREAFDLVLLDGGPTLGRISMVTCGVSIGKRKPLAY